MNPTQLLDHFGPRLWLPVSITLAVALIAVSHRIRTRRAVRAAAAQQREWDENDAWEAALYADDPIAGLAVRGVRYITDEEINAEADRLDQNTWPLPLSPRMTDDTYVPAAQQPMPPARYWLGEARPIAEVDSYIGDAAWTADAFRSGRPIADAGMRRAAVIDAPVSPAAPPSYRPRHDADNRRPPAHGIGYDRAALRVLNEATGAFPIVRELAGASA